MPKKAKSAAGPWRNRIVRHGEEAPEKLIPNPQNWRTHSPAQQKAMSGVLCDVGLVQSIIVNERTGNMIDGHLRVALAIRDKQATVPVVYVDLSPEEEKMIIATIDPLSAMAATDEAILAGLLSEITMDNSDLQVLWDKLATMSGASIEGEDQSKDLTPGYAILISCSSEEEQTELLQKFTDEGLQCRSLIT